MTVQAERVLCRDLWGVLRSIELVDHGPFSSPGSRLEQRLVIANDVQLVRKSVPLAAGRSDARFYELLDNEIRATSRLAQIYGDQLPRELPALVGYNVDVEEPFVLLRAYSGEPADESKLRSDKRQQRRFQIGLLTALQCTAGVGVVHGEVSLAHLWWNGEFAQLVDFESAQRAGDPRRPRTGRHQSPERASGTGLADVRDDVWSAGWLIRNLVLGTSAAGPQVDHNGDPERLRTLLDGVFEAAEERPYPADLLTRMRVRVTPPRANDPETGLAEGRRIFDELGGRTEAPEMPVETVAPQQRGWDRWRRLLFTVAAVAAVLTVAVVIV